MYPSSSGGRVSSLLLLATLAGAGAGGVVGYLVPRALSPVDVRTLSTATNNPELFIAQSDEEQVVRVVKRVLPSIAAIHATQEVAVRTPLDPFFQDTDEVARTPQVRRERVGGGSGFFVSEDGLFVTNRHVVENRSLEYSVVLQDGTRHAVTILDIDPVLDLAILRVEGLRGIEPLALGDSEAVQVGQTVLAIGNALAEYQNSVTKGVVSGINRRIIAGGSGGIGAELIEEAIQTDAAINLGNSGGPLLDIQGRVIGMNTAVSLSGQALGFAIPSNTIKRAIESVQKTGKIVRPWLGVRYFMITEESAKRDGLPVSYGALVSRGSAPRDPAVVTGSPAEKAGIKEGDILLEIQGQKLTDERSLATVLGRFFAGDEIEVKLLRGGEEQTVQVKLDARTSQEKR